MSKKYSHKSTRSLLPTWWRRKREQQILGFKISIIYFITLVLGSLLIRLLFNPNSLPYQANITLVVLTGVITVAIYSGIQHR